MIPKAYESQVISDSAAYINGDEVGDGCHIAFITCEDHDIRYRFDGEAPTAGEGHELGKDTSITLASVEQITWFQAIRIGANDATLRITYGI